jgi:hypothetical protein
MRCPIAVAPDGGRGTVWNAATLSPALQSIPIATGAIPSEVFFTMAISRGLAQCDPHEILIPALGLPVESTAQPAVVKIEWSMARSVAFSQITLVLQKHIPEHIEVDSDRVRDVVLLR